MGGREAPPSGGRCKGGKTPPPCSHTCTLTPSHARMAVCPPARCLHCWQQRTTCCPVCPTPAPSVWKHTRPASTQRRGGGGPHPRCRPAPAVRSWRTRGRRRSGSAPPGQRWRRRRPPASAPRLGCRRAAGRAAAAWQGRAGGGHIVRAAGQQQPPSWHGFISGVAGSAGERPGGGS